MEWFSERCRLCLEENSDNISIFDKTTNLSLQLMTCLSIDTSVNDTLPKTICKKCSDCLHDYFMFYTNAKRCEKILLSFVEKDIPGLSPSGEASNTKTAYITHYGEDRLLSKYFNYDSLELDDVEASPVFDLSEQSADIVNMTQKLLKNGVKLKKIPKNDEANSPQSYEIHMEIDVSDSDLDIVNQILVKETKDECLKNQSYPENYSCLLCKTVFNDFNILSEHMLGCNGIRKRYLNRPNAKQNNNKMNLNCVHRCKICGVIFATKNALHKHVKLTHAKRSEHKLIVINTSEDEDITATNFMYQCQVCRAICADEESLRAHLNDHDCKKSQLLCDLCGKYFKSNQVLSRHILSHVNDMYRCNDCPKRFSNIKSLKRHLAYHPMLVCEKCGSIFKSEALLKSHQTDNICDVDIEKVQLLM